MIRGRLGQRSNPNTISSDYEATPKTFRAKKKRN